MNNVFFFVAGPGDVLLSGSEWRADRMHARHYALRILIDLGVDGQADPRHDPHVNYHVRRVSKLHTDLRHGRTDRTHAERQHIHRASAHGTLKQFLEFAPHLVRLFPVVFWPSDVFGERTNEGAFFYWSNVVRD